MGQPMPAAGTPPPYMIAMVPPNLTGDLHLGHALMTYVQDCLARFQRGLGREVVYVPGTDHAGIGMYALVLAERDFEPDLSLPERLRAWADRCRPRIEGQFRTLRLSCDWERMTYTMAPRYVELVHHAFRRLAEHGLVYRQRRVTPWCPSCGTTISRLECEQAVRDGDVALVPVSVEGRRLIVELPQPELIWSAAALLVPPGAVSEGATAVLPQGQVPTIAGLAEGEQPRLLVPAHDPADFEVALRQGLPVTESLDAAGRSLVPAAPGMGRTELRAWTVERLRLKCMRREFEVVTCGRCDTELSPRPTWQWFLRMRPLAEPLQAALASGEVEILPASQLNAATSWLEKLEDWCLSRQIPWGQRIPAWRCTSCEGWTLEAEERCPACGEPSMAEEDVFDTWFSSTFWPLAAAGWPDQRQVERLYPNTALTTGKDILFFWVLRVLALNRFLTGRFPTSRCYLHGLVRDEQGQKMSKSRGNTVMAEEAIARHGGDVLRAGLLSACHGDADLRYRQEVFRRQTEVAEVLTGLLELGGEAQAAPDSLDQWCYSLLRAALPDVSQRFEAFEFGRALDRLARLAVGGLRRYLQVRRRQAGRRGVPPDLYLETARLFEPVMPETASRMADLACGKGPAIDPDPVLAEQAGRLVELLEELGQLRGSVGLNTAVAIDAHLPPDLDAGRPEHAWLADATPLNVSFAPSGDGAGRTWALPGHPEIRLALPAGAAPRLRQEAARRLRREARRLRRLRRRLEAARAAPDPSYAELAGRLSAIEGRAAVLRRNCS